MAINNNHRGWLFAATITLCSSTISNAERHNQVTELINANHYFDLVRDTPYVHRPPSLIAFFSESNPECRDKFYSLDFNTNGLPRREEVFVGRYDVDKQFKFAWFKFTDDLNLPKVLKVDACPSLVIVPPEYTGRENNTLALDVWDGSGDWKQWVTETVTKYPVKAPSTDFTNELLLVRDDSETRCHYRICITPAKLPSYTKTGYEVIEMPDSLHQRLLNYYKKWEHKRSSEPWDLQQTETNYHETHMSLVSLDHDWQERDSIANDYMKDTLAEWAGVPSEDMKLKSFYGIREYFRGNELRTHIDTITTHVLSAVLCIDQIGIDEDWMLEVLDHNGDRVEIACKPKQIILYESASLPHGRPKPFNGTKFVNAFVHYQPEGWDFLEHTWGVATSATNYQGPFGIGQGDGCTMQRGLDDDATPLHLNSMDDYDDEDEEDEEEEIPAPPKTRDDGKRKVIFTNKASVGRDLWWMGQDGIVFQDSLTPGHSVEMNTFVGHKFMWSSIDKEGDSGAPHSSGAEALRGSKIGDTVEISSNFNQNYVSIDERDEL